MNLSKTLTTLRGDISKGRAWLAPIRLGGAFATAPADRDAVRVNAELAAMRDHASNGR
jgi:hypothetical protein